MVDTFILEKLAEQHIQNSVFKNAFSCERLYLGRNGEHAVSDRPFERCKSKQSGYFIDRRLYKGVCVVDKALFT